MANEYPSGCTITSKTKFFEFFSIIRTMYDFHDSTDTLKFLTEKQAINKTVLLFI